MAQSSCAEPSPAEYRTLARSGLFLADWYADAYQVKCPSGTDLLVEFCRFGWRLGFNPNPYFDCRYYLRQNTDVLQAGINPLLHYLLDGDREGRHPVDFFDPVWYRGAHDVTPTQTCLEHFLPRRTSGLVSPVPGFDPARHLRLHPGLAAAGLDPFLHARSDPAAIAPSAAEVIAASGLFDPSFYLINNPDVRQTGLDPLEHFCRDGAREGRNPNLYFATAWYAEQAGLAEQDGENPLCHYYLAGEAAGLKPSAHFDPVWYGTSNKLAPWQSALRHYLDHRRTQRVSPNPAFDLPGYLTRMGGRLGPNRDAFADWLRRGQPAQPVTPLPVPVVPDARVAAPAPTSAFDRGLGLLRDGDLAQARRWLERARRLEPADAAVALALGHVLIRQRDPESAAFFTSLLRTAQFNEALCGLASAQFMLGDAEAAARSRGLSLSLYAQRFSPNQTDALRLYCKQTGAAGWCGFGEEGVLTLELTETAQPGRISVSFDDEAPFRTLLREAGAAPIWRVRIASCWHEKKTLHVRTEHGRLLGSEIKLVDIIRVEGFVEAKEGGLSGWAWCPNDPEHDPVLSIEQDDGCVLAAIIADGASVSVSHWRPFARPRSFTLGAAALQNVESGLHVIGRDKRPLYGSPLSPWLEARTAAFAARHASAVLLASSSPAAGPGRADRQYAMPPGLAIPVPVSFVGTTSGSAVPAPRCSVVIAVFGARDVTLQCLASVIPTLPAWARVVVVDDASDDEALVEALRALSSKGEIRLLRHATNKGFPSAVNTGLAACIGDDVVLLNSDTLVADGWLDRMREAAYGSATIGTVTPFSNNATILSYPDASHANAVPDLRETRTLDGLAASTRGDPVDIPTAVGFCMFVKSACLAQTGGLREDLFAQGYCEENDLCMRARHLGWRHVAAPNVFVTHAGGKSFAGARAYLQERNLRVLNLLHPGYDKLIEDFRRTDPLAVSRRSLDMLRWQGYRDGRPGVLLVTHGRQGGVRRHVHERATLLRKEGRRPILLWPTGNRHGGKDCVLGEGPEGGTPNLRFCLPDEAGLVVDLLRGDKLQHAEFHNLVGHDHCVIDMCRALDLPYDVFVHDYAWFCPRISLLTTNHRYCGEPDVQDCEACVADNGSEIEETIGVADLILRSTDELRGARRIMAPSQDSAARMRRHFPQIDPAVHPWSADINAGPRTPLVKVAGTMRVCVPGAIGYQKGFEVLLACARDASRRQLDLEFIVVGYTIDDSRLLQTGKVYITGEYDEADSVALIERQSANMAFLPSIWPETWSYTLSQAWEAGLPVLSFDIGAPAERIRANGKGWVIPLGTEPAGINDFLMGAAVDMALS